MGNRHLLHVRSNQVTNNEPKLPQTTDIRYGELAINYAKGNETISLKNSNDEIVSFNIGKSIKGVNVNNVNATIANNIASVTISGSDENVGTYTSVQYPTEFSAATNVSGSQTIADAFNAVETTISALTKEMIKDEKAISESIIQIAESAGLENENEISYVADTNAHYISGATTLYDADKILDSAIYNVATSTQNSLSGVNVNGVDATVSNNKASVVISGNNANVGTYTSVEYPSEFSAATNVSGSQTIADAFNSVENTVSALTQIVFDDELATEKISKAIAEAAGTIDSNNEIKYNVNENAHYISAATSLANADDILDSKISTINYAESQTNPGGPAKMAVSIPFGVVDSTSVATAFTATIDGITELRDGVCCYLKNGKVTSTTGFTIDVNGLGAKPCYTNLANATRDTTVFNSGYTFLFVYNTTRNADGCWDIYRGYDSNSDVIGKNIVSQSSQKTKTKLYRYQILLTYDEEYLLPVNEENNKTATTKTLTTESFNPFGQVYWYNSTTSAATSANIAASTLYTQYSGLSLTYAFNTASGLTAKKDVYIVCTPQADGKVKLASNPISQTLPTTNDGLIYKYIGFAVNTYQICLMQDKPCYYFKDNALRLWTNQTETDISGKADINHTHVSSAVTIEEDYQEISYPQSFSGATNVESGQTVTEAFHNVETTISALTQELINDELVNAKSITALGSAAGTIDENSVIKYEPNENAKYISAATTLYDADSLLDAAISNIASSSQNSISGVNVNGVDATITNKVANVGISGNNINVGTYTEVEYPQYLSGATPVSGTQTINQAFSAVETTISALTQEVLNDELVTENAIKALGNAAGTIDSNDNIKYVAPSSAKYISAATSVYDATVLLDTALQNNSGSISSITLNGTAATITNKVAALTASGSSINVGSYTSVTYPASLTGASNVSSGQSVAQAFNSVETTISAVTTAMDNKADKVKVINHGTTGTTFTLPPNEMHVWGSVSTLTLNLATPTDNTIVNEYLFSFTSPLSATTLSLPASVKWVFELVVEPEKTYTISIVDNLATYLTEDMSIIGADESVLAQKEDISNKVTTIDQNSSDVQYPSAKCVYDYIEARLLQLNS